MGFVVVAGCGVELGGEDCGAEGLDVEDEDVAEECDEDGEEGEGAMSAEVVAFEIEVEGGWGGG